MSEENILPLVRPSTLPTILEKFAHRSLQLIEGAIPRILHFPNDGSLGKLKVANSMESESWWEFSERTFWEDIGDAKGSVFISPSKIIALDVMEPMTWIEWPESAARISYWDFMDIFSGSKDIIVHKSLLRQFVQMEPNEFLSGVLGGAILRHEEVDLSPLRSFSPNALTSIAFAFPTSDATLSHIAHLTGLRYVDLCGSPITDVGLQYLSQLINLQTLHLEEVKISENGVKYLSSLKELKYLSLRWTRITDKGIIHLKSLKNLQCLDLQGTNVSAAALPGLRKSLPECLIWPFDS
jgi:hypothetical protein